MTITYRSHQSIHNYEDIQQINCTNKKSFKILYINFRSLNEKTEELILNTLQKQNILIDIITLTEHWMDKLKTSKYTLNGFNTIFSSRPLKKGGGSAIFINNKLKYNIITQYSDDLNSITTICIQNDNKHTNICCIYRPPYRNVDEVNKFLNTLDDHLQKLIKN